MNNTKPEYGGECALAVSLGKKDVHCDGKHFIVDNGKQYNFTNPVAKFLWKVLPGRKQKADSQWSSR
ncbi:hypothetical protein [Bacillus sp. 2205SS5-2]|uniref:hypothetical protein n=1 Tax=Bacillus sp. 2205SS5-2 TaxID=3109031 RepID=UPI003006561B